MASRNEATVREFFRAVEREDFDTLARLVGPGYIWIDHTTDAIASTPEDLQAAVEEDAAWSEREFLIERAMTGTDGTVIVQITNTQTLTGEWRSIRGSGQRVRREICEIFHFDAEGPIVVEEMYEDTVPLLRQLGVTSD
jgi:ketosteroid isomerase-like protein